MRGTFVVKGLIIWLRKCSEFRTFIPELMYFWKLEFCKMHDLAVLNAWRLKNGEWRKTD